MNNILSKSQQLLLTYQKVSLNRTLRQLSIFVTQSDGLLTEKRLRTNNAFIQSTNSRNIQVYVPDRKGGYKTGKEVSTKEHILDGLKQLKHEIIMWKNEMKEKLANDPVLIYRPGETDVLWAFGQNKGDIDKFIHTSDSDHNEGKSHCTFEISPAGYGLFSGHLDSSVPLEGRLRRAGYCNIRSQRHRKSFQRDAYYEWSPYNTLVMRIRGDGRPYMLNLTCDGTFDIMWNDMFQYVLYTRGGPHWQTTRIPFSKFFLASKGRIQDKQAPIPLNKISSFGITAAGRALMDGAFSLEIDYIGLEFDPLNTEEFAYEMYKVPDFIIGN